MGAFENKIAEYKANGWTVVTTKNKDGDPVEWGSVTKDGTTTKSATVVNGHQIKYITQEGTKVVKVSPS